MQPFCLVEGIRLLKCVKEGVEFEITVQESRGFRVRALQRRVLAEKTVGTLLLDNLPSAFGLPQEAHQVPHSANEARGRNMSGIRAGTGLPKQRQAGLHQMVRGRAVAFHGVPVANPDKDECCVGSKLGPIAPAYPAL